MSFLDSNGLKHYTDKLLQNIQSNASGVTSFNGRTGEVLPVTNDYSVSMISGAVPETRTINGKPLSSDITLNASDIEGVGSVDLSGYVPTTRTVNGKPLSSDITLNASDIEGVGSVDLSGYVPTTRTVNGKALSSNITLSASDVDALPTSGGTLTGDLKIKNSGNYGTTLSFGDGDYVHISEPVDDCMEIKANKVNFVLANTTDSKFTINGTNPFGAASGSYVPTTRTVNGKALSSDITLNGYDVCNNKSAQTIAIGYNATSRSSSSGKSSISIGYDVSSNSPSGGISSIAVGYNINAGQNSIMIGERLTSSYDDTMSHRSSIGIGMESSVLTGSIVIGDRATGDKFSVAVGHFTESTTGVSVGYAATSNNHSLAIGPSSTADAEDCAAIGYFATCSELDTHVIQLGSEALSKLRCRVGLSVTSDERDKTDITPIGDGAVEFLNKIKAIRYVFNGRELYIPEDENLSDVDKANKSKYGMCSYDKEAHALGTKKGERVRVGVLAQEVQKALEEVYGDKSYANLVDDNFFDLDKSTIPEGVENKLTMTYENFIPFLIKAVQELSEDVKYLKNKVEGG